MPTIDSTSYTSPNHSARLHKIDCLVLHHGGGTKRGDLARLTDNTVPLNQRVSAHYYVDRAGAVYQLVQDTRVAWHAGESVLAGATNVNEFSIGIETEHAIGQDWPGRQLDSLAWLCRQKIAQYGIPLDRVVSHRAIAPDRKVDPADSPLAPESAFRLWVATLAVPALPPRPMPRHGLVITSGHLNDIEDKISAGGYDTCKYITAWGNADSPTGAWNPASIARAVALTPYTVIRTLRGDPSAGYNFLHWEYVIAEIAPWYAVRQRRLFIELGNEPNSDPTIDPSGYAYHLKQSIDHCRAAYPRATLIAPALVLDRPNVQQWLANSDYAAAIRLCDLLAVHVYAFESFDDTGQLAKANSLYPGYQQRLALTEYGINSPTQSDASKGQQYARLVQGLPDRYALATFFHYDIAAQPGTNHAYYSIDSTGDSAYCIATKG